MTALHPDTGRAYIAVMPSCGAFMDIWSCYLAVSDPRIWFDVIEPDRFEELLFSVRDENVVFVHWAPNLIDGPSLPRDRRALVLPVYSEALDRDESVMLPDHIRDWHRFLELAPYLDGFFAHTPKMVEMISLATGKRGFVLPVGWDPVMGTPAWDRSKSQTALFAGSMVGRRESLIPLIQKHVQIQVLSGVYGNAMHEAMNDSKTTLYVAHSAVGSYSTWRIWQAMCSSSALVTEPGDWWPLEPELCYPIQMLDSSNVEEAATMINEISYDDARSRARALHESLSHFTTSRCIDRDIVIATSNLSR